jgi:hypothetical protein
MAVIGRVGGRGGFAARAPGVSLQNAHPKPRPADLLSYPNMQETVAEAGMAKMSEIARVPEVSLKRHDDVLWVIQGPTL